MNVALVVAAGNGSRMKNLDIPKQFLLINEKPLFIYSIEAFERNNNIDAIIVVTSQDYLEQVKKWCDQFKLNKVKDVVVGGTSRQQSVYHGLLRIKQLSANPDSDIVLIHDAARPLVSQDIIDSNILASQKYDAVATAINANDTIIRSKDGQIIEDVPLRKELYQSQTPQSFKLSLILKAHESAKNNELNEATDDAQLVLATGEKVHLVKGEKTNFKITTADDLVILNVLLK